MQDRPIPSLVDLDSLALSEETVRDIPDFSDRSRCTAYLVLDKYPERIVRGEIEWRTIEPKPPTKLIYALGIGSVANWGKICKGLFYVEELNKRIYPDFIYLNQLKSFTSLIPKERFE